SVVAHRLQTGAPELRCDVFGRQVKTRRGRAAAFEGVAGKEAHIRLQIVRAQAGGDALRKGPGLCERSGGCNKRDDEFGMAHEVMIAKSPCTPGIPLIATPSGRSTLTFVIRNS